MTCHIKINTDLIKKVYSKNLQATYGTDQMKMKLFSLHFLPSSQVHLQIQILNLGSELLLKLIWPYLVRSLCRTHPSSLDACAKKRVLGKLSSCPLTVFVDPLHNVLGHGKLPKSFQHSLRCCSFPNRGPPHLHQLTSLRNQIFSTPSNMDLDSPLLLILFSQRLPRFQTPRQSQAHKQDLVQNLNKIVVKMFFKVDTWAMRSYYLLLHDLVQCEFCLS